MSIIGIVVAIAGSLTAGVLLVMCLTAAFDKHEA
jgi:hypothetical protein